MSDHLKLSDPNSDAELDKIASALEDADNLRYQQLKKRIQGLERQLAERTQAAQSNQAKPNNKIGARKNGIFKAISTAPSFNYTPLGTGMVPLPYPTTIDLTNSAGVASSVRFNGQPVYTLSSSQPSCKGDEHGSGGGIKSGTVNGEVKPTGASTTVRAEGKRVVRDGDPCTMNGGNNPGIYTTVPAASSAAPRDALATSNPPIKLETPAEESGFKKWLHHTIDAMEQAVKSPVEGLKGAAKGIANIPSNVTELFLKASKEQNATQMDEAAMTQIMFGQTGAAKTMIDVATEARKQEAAVDVPKFKMNNPAQEGGDAIATAIQLFAGGVGLAKGAAGTLPKIASKTHMLEKTALESTAKIAADESKDGIKVIAETTARAAKRMSREDLADWFREKHGMSDDTKINDMIASFDSSKPIELIELPKDTKVVQYVRVNGAVGTFFAYPGTAADALAISEDGRTLVEFVVSKPVEVLRGTAAAEFPIGKYPGVGGKGGGTQLIFPKGDVGVLPTNHS